MPILVDELTVWDIGFRWAGYDPDGLWIRFPLPVKDNFRLLMEAILTGELVCMGLCLDKRPPESKADPRYYIRAYTDEVYDCIAGRRYSRRLLRWATLQRFEFLEWCTVRGIPPPEFWFPPGWKLTYESPYDGIPPGLLVRHEEPEDDSTLVRFSYEHVNRDLGAASAPTILEGAEIEPGNDLSAVPDVGGRSPANAQRPNQLAKVACQQIAKAIWRKEPERTIASIVVDPLVQEYGGASFYVDETVREWVKEVAPPHVRARRGRPPKKGDEG